MLPPGQELFVFSFGDDYLCVVRVILTVIGLLPSCLGGKMRKLPKDQISDPTAGAMEDDRCRFWLKRSRSVLHAIAIVGATGVVLSACSSSSSSANAYNPSTISSSTTAAIGNATALLKVANTAHGTILVTSSGLSLYTLTADTPTTSACLSKCLTIWPPLTTTGIPKVGTGVNQKLISTLTLPNGSKQVVYDGHPLYTFSGDTHAGQYSGEGLTFPANANPPKGYWYLVSESGSTVTS